MMARLLTDEAVAPSASEVGPTKPQHITQRKLSFKTRQSSTSSRGHYRASKVSLTSTNVALIASKFNTIVIDDAAQGRALLRKLSESQRKEKSRPVKTRGEGMVKAAIEIFEHQDSQKEVKSAKKNNDSRPKLVVLRKSSSRSSMKVDDSQKAEPSKKSDYLSKESAKENKRSEIKCDETNNTITTNADIKEIKRKPSLKAKPVLRHSVVVKQGSVNSLNQRIAKFNSIDSSTNGSVAENVVQNQPTRKPNFSLNERIAQFNKNERNMPNNKENNLMKMDKNTPNEPNRLSVCLEEKENRQEVTKSILRNTKNKTGLVEQTKDRLVTMIQQSNTNNLDSKVSGFKKQSLIKDKFIVGERKELKVFHGVPEIKPIGLSDDTNHKLSVPKTADVLDNAFLDTSRLTVQLSQNNAAHLYKSSESSNVQLDQGKSTQEIYVKNSKHKDLGMVTLPPKDPCALLKPSLKTVSSESPKLEKKTLCVASDPSHNLQLDRIKPNNSFLWKPASRISVVTDVPIYDDRPESRSSDSVFENDSTKLYYADIEDKESSDEEDCKTENLDLDVASSFILEMTEHIERRFSSGSAQEKDSDEVDVKAPLEEVKDTIVIKNSSFLHGKRYGSLVSSSASGLDKSENFIVPNKPNTARPTKVPPPVNKKPGRVIAEECPPKLPEKKPKVSGEFGENLEPNPPPIPPSHTKPKLTHTLSQETWLNNCKAILELPPPLRKKNGEESSADLPTNSSATLRNRGSPPSDNGKKDREKRFSVSQVELLKRMTEMNLNSKRNSLPPNATSLYDSYVDPDEEDHYSQIRHFDIRRDDDQDTYEDIGENNYAEIQEYERDGEEGNNIYDDVDHYEAINSVMVQGDSDSSCDQSNSLYGLARPTSLTVPGSVYQVSAGSETSDEWVDLDNSDEQHESVIIFREKERGRGLVPTESWSMKVRRQWSRKGADDDDGSEESVPKFNENIDNIDETSYCDDFDDSFSDSSFDHDAVNPHVQEVETEKRSQPLSEGIYGLMKQAGHHMRKHWSLGKSLTRMRKNKSAPNVTSSGNLGRRGWSFKTRDKPMTAQSTFYLHGTNTLPRKDAQPETRPDPRRLSTASIVARPTSPPPPPPPRNSIDESGKRKSDLNNLNNSSGDNEGYIEGQRRLSRNGNSMWYIETSTDSASEHGSSQGSDLNLRFADEPLYQFYAANIDEMTLSELTQGETDGYEEITPPSPPSPRPSALDLVSVSHHRSLWCEVPQVRNSGVLDTLTQSQKRLQEAKFEVMTSEASYFKSLTVLDKLFSSCPLFSDENILSKTDRKILFGNVSTVRKCSEKLLAALQKCWQDCILLQGICDVVHDHVKAYKEVYVKYCTNQISMDRTLKHLKQTNSNFSTVLTQLETDPECQSLALYSFLMLPMQRITRLRLLFDTMLSLLDSTDADFTPCQRTLHALNTCVMECNEGARTQERLEEMVRLSKQLEFPTEMAVPLLGLGSSRWLVRSGQVTQVNMDAKHTFGRRLSRTGPKFTLFLFTDLFLVAKKKSEESYLVVDHCQRSLVETQELRDFPGNNRFLLQITLLENHDNKTSDMTVSCDNETDRQRWLQVLTSPQPETEGETLYEGWDCPQVTTVHSYQPRQPDELPLALGDIINVLRKSEGWFYGERTRDGEKGWFPGNYTREIASKHVRARNLKQRHRLLQLSADLVQQQRKTKS